MSHRASKRERAAQRAANLRRLYALCLARCGGDLSEAVGLYQKTSAQFPAMTMEVQGALLAAMAQSIEDLRSRRLIKGQAAGSQGAVAAPSVSATQSA